MGKLLWEPSAERKKNASITKFVDLVNKRYQENFHSYEELHGWSINHVPDFWACMWDFAEIKASQYYEMVVDDVSKMSEAKWFIGAKLNFAENLLTYRGNRTALIFKGETQESVKMSHAELHDAVARLTTSLR